MIYLNGPIKLRELNKNHDQYAHRERRIAVLDVVLSGSLNFSAILLVSIIMNMVCVEKHGNSSFLVYYIVNEL